MPPRKPKKPRAENSKRSLLRDYTLSLSTSKKDEGYTARLQVEDKEGREVVLTLEASLDKEGGRLHLNLKGSEVDLWELLLKLLETL